MSVEKNFYQHGPWMKLRRRTRLDGNFTCSRCGEQVFGRELHAHHIKELKRAPALGLEPLNIRLVCQRCHNIEHGRGNEGCDIDGFPLSANHPWNKAKGG